MTLMYLESSIIYNHVCADIKIQKKKLKLLKTNRLPKYVYIYIKNLYVSLCSNKKLLIGHFLTLASTVLTKQSFSGVICFLSFKKKNDLIYELRLFLLIRKICPKLKS